MVLAASLKVKDIATFRRLHCNTEIHDIKFMELQGLLLTKENLRTCALHETQGSSARKSIPLSDIDGWKISESALRKCLRI